MIFEGKRILVTGGTGSMGRALVRRLLGGQMGTPSKVIVLSRDEAKQHAMRLEFLHKRVTTDEVIYRNFKQTLEFRIGNVRSYADVCSAVRDADIVVNAAALKQVPTCEYFPDQAVQTNCMGATNIVRAIREQGLNVETVIGVSTDKACKPINVMGMTKAIQERIFISANVLAPDTRFICVRYGNVLASRGSVIPLFADQIRNGGPVTVTVPEMTRFLLSIDDAADLIFAAVTSAKRGEIYVPNIPSATVMNVAKAMVGDRDIEIETIGVRPGEKMHEILISEAERSHVVKVSDKYFAILPMLPELRMAGDKVLDMPSEYSSADSVIDLQAVTSLLAKNNLLVDQG
ncbi:MAG: polysaccharide biosynthesis protein [Phycisphaerae bacterium]|nr:polysaccharide biosynthesis protein [Phycisphaerae bacterium]